MSEAEREEIATPCPMTKQKAGYTVKARFNVIEILRSFGSVAHISGCAAIVTMICFWSNALCHTVSGIVAANSFIIGLYLFDLSWLIGMGRSLVSSELCKKEHGRDRRLDARGPQSIAKDRQKLGEYLVGEVESDIFGFSILKRIPALESTVNPMRYELGILIVAAYVGSVFVPMTDLECNELVYITMSFAGFGSVGAMLFATLVHLDFLGEKVYRRMLQFEQEESADGSTSALSRRAFRLLQNYPNPFYRSTQISYSLPQTAQVTLSIYDITGRLVEILVDKSQQPGIHQVHWDRKTNPSGVYSYRLNAGEFVETRKMVVVE